MAIGFNYRYLTTVEGLGILEVAEMTDRLMSDHCYYCAQEFKYGEMILHKADRGFTCHHTCAPKSERANPRFNHSIREWTKSEKDECDSLSEKLDILRTKRRARKVVTPK